LYDFTSSGLTNVHEILGPNKKRKGAGHTEVNFGYLEISKKKKKLFVKGQIRAKNKGILEEVVLEFPASNKKH
jgi:hypothetical protein